MEKVGSRRKTLSLVASAWDELRETRRARLTRLLVARCAMMMCAHCGISLTISVALALSHSSFVGGNRSRSLWSSNSDIGRHLREHHLNTDSKLALGHALAAKLSPHDMEDAADEFPPPDARHYIKGNQLYPPWPVGMEQAVFGMGCFWSAEALFMHLDGVYSTHVGFAGGTTTNPRYDDICGGKTGHAEVVRVVFDPQVTYYRDMLRIFWEGHDPTSWNCQGKDRGTEYRSVIFYFNQDQGRAALETRAVFQQALLDKNIKRPIRTEILPAPEFYYAEQFHQQCEAKPGGSSTGSSLCPTGAVLT